ncbi:hypothetical protein ABIB82_007740 [Bradyrhizobium sp. i1.8.4]
MSETRLKRPGCFGPWSGYALHRPSVVARKARVVGNTAPPKAWIVWLMILSAVRGAPTLIMEMSS